MTIFRTIQAQYPLMDDAHIGSEGLTWIRFAPGLFREELGDLFAVKSNDEQ